MVILYYLTFIELTDGRKISAEAFIQLANDIYDILHTMQIFSQFFQKNDIFVLLFFMKSLFSYSRLVLNHLA